MTTETTTPRRPTAREQQRDLINRFRTESIVGKGERLGMPPWPSRPERGETVQAYYGKKHGPGGAGRGRFWPLHVVQALPHWATKH